MCQYIHAAVISRSNLQLIAVEQRSRQSCLDVLHSLRLELILGLELFRRLIAQILLALSHCNTIVLILSQQITYELLPPVVPEMSETSPRQQVHQHDSTHAALWPSGTLASTALISAGPKPVAVLLCLGLVMPGGPTAVWKSLMGEETLGLRSLGAEAVLGDSAISVSLTGRTRKCR